MEVNDIHGHLFVISGPSAVGKTTVANKILELDEKICRVVTCTTRATRKNEIDGIDYNFMSMEEFTTRKNNGEFVEYSNIYGNYYGILFSSIFDKIKHKGNCVILVINWEGFLKIKKIIFKNLFGFFLLPPTIKELESRIRNRSTESEKEIKKRIDTALEDISHAHEFDTSIKNINIINTAHDILQIINSIRYSYSL